MEKILKNIYCLLIIFSIILFSNSSIADADAGKKVFNKCKSCHVLKEEQNRLGPNLVKIFGRKSGSLEDYNYSGALKEANLIWNDETLKGYLSNPRKYLPGNKMAFAGVKDEKQLNDLIDYLKQESN